jgi:hypothetical protein
LDGSGRVESGILCSVVDDSHLNSHFLSSHASYVPVPVTVASQQSETENEELKFCQP